MATKKSKSKTISKRFKSLRLATVFPYILIVFSIIGIGAAAALTLEELAIYKNPNHHPSCSINPVVSCGPIMQSKEAHVVGSVPNPYMGLVGFSIILCVGVSMIAGAKMAKWYWQTFQAAATAGLAFVIWLMIHSIYVIQTLCIYCMTTWVVVSVIFWYLLQWNLESGFIKINPKYSKFIRKYHGEILITWFLIIIFMILNHFWYFFGPK